MSSWFNLSGNLSSIASNVSSFTKEVLQDATTADSSSENINTHHTEFEQNSTSFNDYERSNDLLNKISSLQAELHSSSNENAHKDQQIQYLQTENEETLREYEKHFSNLKQDLLEKEIEIETFAEKIHGNETQYKEKINFLNQEYSNLEAKLAAQNLSNNMDSEWGNEWGQDDFNQENYNQEVNDLRNANESLSNEVSMKEIILNSIESKMREISNKCVDAADFSEWIDEMLNEKIVAENKGIQISHILSKNMNETITNMNEEELHQIDEWFTQQQNIQVELENRNTEHKAIISNIEKLISGFGDGVIDFKIDHFSQWLENVANELQNDYIICNDDTKNMLDKIQNEIREFDDEDEDFQIENFQSWLEKVQSRIDDLEVELINEQEVRDGEEKQRIVERETLHDMFTKKEREISLLKVELYNKSSSNALSPIMEVEQASLMTVQEQLNEVSARCEALQYELTTSQKKVVELEDLQILFKETSNDYELLKEQFSTKETLELELNDFKVKYNSLSEEFDQLHKEHDEVVCKYESLQVTESKSDVLQIQVDEISTKYEHAKEELVTFESIKEGIDAELNEYKEKYNSLSEELDKLHKEHDEVVCKYESLQVTESKSDVLQIQVNDISTKYEHAKEELVISESIKEGIEAELNEYKDKYNSLSEEFDKLHKECEEVTCKYESIQTTESKSDNLQIQFNEMSAKYEHVNEQLISSISMKDGIQAELSDFKAKYNSLSEEFDKLHKEHDEVTCKYESIQTAESKSDDLQIQFNEVSAKYGHIKEQLVSSESMKAGIEAELIKFTAKYNSQTEEFDKLYKEHNERINKYELLQVQETTSAEQISEYGKLQEINNELLSELEKVNDEVQENVKLNENLENELKNLKTEYNLLKLVELQTGEDKESLQTELLNLKETHSKLSMHNNKFIVDSGNIDFDMKIIGSVLNNINDGSFQLSELDISSSYEKFAPLFESVKGVAEKYVAIQNQYKEFNNVIDDYKTQLQVKEWKLESCGNLTDILIYMGKSLDNLLPEEYKGNFTINDALSTTEMSHYISYIKSFEEFIQKFKEHEDSDINSKIELQKDLQNTENLLELERLANNRYVVEVDKLSNSIEEYKKTIENLKTESSKPSTGSGGMKFGAIKRKLQDIESLNQSLVKENEELKRNDAGKMSSLSPAITDQLASLKSMVNDKTQECECYQEECKLLKSSLLEMQDQMTITDSVRQECRQLKEKLMEYENALETQSNASDEASLASRHHQEQLHSLSLMLTERNEELEHNQEETEYLKSKLIEIENDSSDLELIREECKHLKAMLVGKEENDTISLLQSESKQLKQLLNAKNSEMQQMQNLVLEKENDLSNMELIQEECKQLKQMLISKGEDEKNDDEKENLSLTPTNDNWESVERNVPQAVLETSSSEIDLLRGECEKLKSILLNNSPNINRQSSNTSEEISNELLEVMLEDRDIQINLKNAIITELQNKTSDMDLIQEECRQLKIMLVEKGQQSMNTSSFWNNSNNETANNSFVQQVKQLEEFLKEKEDLLKEKEKLIENIRRHVQQLQEVLKEKEEIIKHMNEETEIERDQVRRNEEILKEKEESLKEKDSELKILNTMIIEKDNFIADFDLIQNECNILKEMLTEKEKVFIELQDDLDTSNSVVQQKNEEYKLREKSFIELEKRMNMKDNEIQSLNEEIIAQDENLHMLQTEYRNVEERLKLTENNLDQVQQKLNESENNYERFKVYAEQHESLSICLKQRDEELTNLKLQFSENSAMEGETVTLLRLELNELKKLLYESEEKNKLINDLLQKKEIEMQNVNTTCVDLEKGIAKLHSNVTEKEEKINHLNCSVVKKETEMEHLTSMHNELKGELNKSCLEVEKINHEKNALLQLCGDEEMKVKTLEDHVADLQEGINRKICEVEEMNKQIVSCKDNIAKQDHEITALMTQIEQNKVEKVNMDGLTSAHNEVKYKYCLELESLNDEKNTLLHLCGDQDTKVKTLENRVAELQEGINRKIREVEEMNKKIMSDEDIITKKNHEINELITHVEQKQVEKKNLLHNVNDNQVKLNAQEEKYQELETSYQHSKHELSKSQDAITNHLNDIITKKNKISQLESELFRSQEYQEQLVESMKAYSSRGDQNVSCKNCEFFSNERKMINTILENIQKILQSQIDVVQRRKDGDVSIVEILSIIEASLQNLLTKTKEKEVEITKLHDAKNELQINHKKVVDEKLQIIFHLEKQLKELQINNEKIINEKSQLISDLGIQLKELQLKNEKVINEKTQLSSDLEKQSKQSKLLVTENESNYEFKIKDLQSQLLENNEIQDLYEKKCIESKHLEEQLIQLKNENNKQLKSYEISSKSVINEECERLRFELGRNSHSLLGKNKECDHLKLEMLQLEENIYELKLSLEYMKKFEKTALHAEHLQATLKTKNEEIDQLKSVLEDNELKLEGSRKEKTFLDELLKVKECLEKEKEELLFQNEQRDRFIQEKEVLLRHKDITCRELESKNNRELERLRNHMIMTEESHTKDIIECQQREQALQQELEEVRHGLSKKSIILQDSSKQFQEHCIDLEEQLHTLSSQRDTVVLDLAKCQDKIKHDAAAIYNLQSALDQLQKEKIEQSDYLSLFAKRKAAEYESRIFELTDDLNKTQGAMSEAALAVQGINKLNLELQQKENELKVGKDKISELSTTLQQRELERDKMLEAVDSKLDKSLLRNLLLKYFQSPNDKRTDILHVIGGLLGWSPEELWQIGNGSAPSVYSGWISNVWGGRATPKTPTTPAQTPTYDSNKSFSELFVNFLENETAGKIPVNTTSLTLSNEAVPRIQMFTPSTPDILAFHSTPDQRIPAPGQEIPRVHTNHAQSTLKSLLS